MNAEEQAREYSMKLGKLSEKIDDATIKRWASTDYLAGWDAALSAASKTVLETPFGHNAIIEYHFAVAAYKRLQALKSEAK